MKKIIYLMLLAMIGIAFTSMTAAQKPWKTPDKYATMKATKSTPESVQIGKDLYTKMCKSCHGGKGLGDGTKVASLSTTIVSFNSKEYKGLKDGDKYYRSFIGRDEMPNFEKKIPNDSDRWALIHYMNTL